MTTERPIFRQSLETQNVVKLLSDDNHDDLFTYDEISKAIGSDVAGHPGCLVTARRTVQREKQVVFETVRGVGIKRCSDADIVNGRAKDIAGIRGIARRGMKKIACVKNYDALPGDVKQRHNVYASGLALLHHATTNSAQAKIEQKVVQSKLKLPVAEAIAAIGG